MFYHHPGRPGWKKFNPLKTNGWTQKVPLVSKDKHRPKPSIHGFHVYLDLPRGALLWMMCWGAWMTHHIFLRVQTAPFWKMLVFKHVFIFLYFHPDPWIWWSNLTNIWWNHQLDCSLNGFRWVLRCKRPEKNGGPDGCLPGICFGDERGGDWWDWLIHKPWNKDPYQTTNMSWKVRPLFFVARVGWLP